VRLKLLCRVGAAPTGVGTAIQKDDAEPLARQARSSVADMRRVISACVIAFGDVWRSSPSRDVARTGGDVPGFYLRILVQDAKSAFTDFLGLGSVLDGRAFGGRCEIQKRLAKRRIEGPCNPFQGGPVQRDAVDFVSDGAA